MAEQGRSALKRVGWIFGVTVFFELLIVTMGGDIPKVLFRFLVLAILFALLLKGYRFARYILGLLYLAGGLFALFAVLSNISNPFMALAMLPFGLWSLAAAWFFLRSKALAAWTRSD
ncbi:hypothetical protein [uncultured Massilia sp.]|uniref:hypothetical protein n=1 Tax=uncultured Massilia sp. TaxID=169973 RepID=UPI0025844105|nr:hypothetical protein [uncultured Massilia sp.]